MNEFQKRMKKNAERKWEDICEYTVGKALAQQEEVSHMFDELNVYKQCMLPEDVFWDSLGA